VVLAFLPARRVLARCGEGCATPLSEAHDLVIGGLTFFSAAVVIQMISDSLARRGR
jgi:hypothetical protein